MMYYKNKMDFAQYTSSLFVMVVLAIFWFFSGWLQPQVVLADTTNTNYAGTAADGATGEKCAWQNAGNATGDTTGTSATCDMRGNGSFTNILEVTNFGFTSSDIPSGATIDGVTVEVEWQGGSSIQDTTAQLTTDGSNGVGNNKGSDTTHTSKAIQTYGGSADGWGASLTQADVTSSNFGILLQYQKNSGGPSELTSVYRVRVTIDYTPAITTTVGSDGSQVSSISVGTNDAYLGGAFTFINDTQTVTVDSITITETGSVDASSNISNVDIYYETAGTCTYDGDETLFGTDTSLTSEQATVTGSMDVGTSQVCGYIVFDLASGASTANDIDMEISDPSTDVSVGTGSVSPASIVGISGTTSIVSTSFDQSGYRFFANQDSTDVGSTLASENTAVTLTSAGQNFRLRQLLHISGVDLSTSGENLKLQFADKDGGTCASPGGSYADVTTGTAIAWSDNATPSDGDALTDNANDPTHSGHTINNQTYEEGNNFTNSQSAIAAGEDGLWDFSLTDNGAPEGTTYCLRAVKSDDTTLSTYSQYPEVTTFTTPTPVFSAEDFRFFTNQDGTDVGSALAAENTDTTLSSAGQNFRLRSLLHVSDAELAQSGQDFQLQYADQTGYGSCSVIPDGDYEAVTDSTGSGGTAGADWEEATSSASWVERQGHTSVVYDNKMWVLGGHDGNNYLNDVWHSTNGANWTEATSSAAWSVRRYHTSVVYDGKIWVFGGYDGSGRLNDVWYYASSTDSWTEATSSAAWVARNNHTSVVYDNKMWVLGGHDGSNYLNDVWYSTDGVNWTEATTSAAWAERDHHTSVAYDNKMWVLGGFQFVDTATSYNDVWYSTDGVNWTEATSSAGWSERNSHASVVYDNKMWVLGSGTKNDVWHSSDGVNWTEATSSAPWSARQSHTSVAYDNKMWLMGGTSGGEINDVWHSPLGGSTIAFNDNTTPTDGTALTDNANDPTHSGHTINNQTYEETNNFTNSQSAIAAGEDGLWDFSLTVDSEAPTSTTYCLRPTEADGTLFDTYNQYPEVTTYNGTDAVSVTISDGTISYGTLSGDTASSTVGSDTQTASNDGSVTIDLNIQGQDTACPWTLAGTTGIDQYMHEFSTNSGSSWTALTTTYQTLATGITSSGTQDFDLQVTTPTDSSCDTMQSVDVTVQAVEQ